MDSLLERTVLIELQNEYEYVCRTHKIKLSPIAISLYDSTTRWGEYHHLTRTIYLSRRLILTQPWYNVVGILRHEMAHHLVSEQLDTELHETSPHGSVFQNACRKLGVPHPFTRAGITLQENSLDWRESPQNEAAEKMIDKTKKLLALASSTNEHEAQLAMNTVRELYSKYNLDLHEKTDFIDYVHQVISFDKKSISAWEQRIISILHRHFFVKTITLQQFDVRRGCHLQALEIIGRRENVLMAEYVFHFLRQQVEFLLEQVIGCQQSPNAQHTVSPNSRLKNMSRRERNSYRIGVLEGFENKLSASEGVEKNSVVSKALTIFRGDAQIESYLSLVYPRLTRHRSGETILSEAAFHAGRRDGHSIVIHRPLTEHKNFSGKLLN